MVSFVGETSAVLDTNGRVSLPSAFRDVLPENEKKFYLTLGKNNSLILFRENDFNENERPKILAMPSELRISAARDAQVIVLDEKQNRFLLPKRFKEHAGIGKDVVFVGAINKILIYSQENYEKRGFGKFEYDE
jgi:MraZ protein